MVDPATVLIDPDTLSEDELRRMLAPQSLQTVRWVVLSTKQTLDGLHADVFSDLSLFNGLDAHPVLVHLGIETARMQQQAQSVLGEMDNTLKVSPTTEAVTAAVDADAPDAHGALRQRVSSLVRETGSLVRRTDRALRTAGREAIERARYESVRIIHNLADAGGYALRLATSSRARQTMRVIVAVVAVGALGVQVIPALFGLAEVVGGAADVIGALGAVQELVPEREVAGEAAAAPVPDAAPSAQSPSQFIVDLRNLKTLHTDGVLTDEEFMQAKQKVLEPGPCP